MHNPSIPMEAWGTCHQHSCDEVLPWDMAAVAINESNVFCTPECAMEYLIDSVEDRVNIITIHDPQYQADHERINSSENWHSQDESVNIHRRVTSYVETGIAIDELHEMMTGSYRVSFEAAEMEGYADD